MAIHSISAEAPPNSESRIPNPDNPVEYPPVFPYHTAMKNLYQDHKPPVPPVGTLVCIPGVNSGAYLMEGAVQALGQAWRVVLANPPGTGDVPLPMPLTVQGYAQQVWDTLHSIGVTGPVVLLGHSLGGYAAQEMARLRPRQVQRLILASTSMGQPDTAADMSLMARKLGMNFWEMQQLNINQPEEGQKKLFGPGFAEREPEVFAWFMQQRNANMPPHAASLAQLTAGGAFTSRAWARSIETPTLVVHGTADIMVSARSGSRLAQALPNATWLALHNVGHFPMLEHPHFWRYVAAYAQGGSLGEQPARGTSLLHRLWQRVMGG